MGSQLEGDATAAIAADEVVYLHGVLEATVFEAEHLHNAIHGRIMEVKTGTPLFVSALQ
jgi:phospholipase D1/2